MSPLVFAVVCESAADFRTGTSLAERIILEKVEWIDEDQAHHFFVWKGRDLTSPSWSWGEMKTIAREAGIKTHGHFDGKPGLPDAKAARRALSYLRGLMLDGEPIDGILLIRDNDGYPDRQTGLEQGRNSVPDLKDRVVIGVAHYKRECWVLAGFLPSDSRETTAIAELRQILSFDPCTSSHRLTAKEDHEVRSAKRVLDVLTQKVYEREEACWRRTSLDTLRQRGGPSGLAAYLAEVEERLVPLILVRS